MTSFVQKKKKHAKKIYVVGIVTFVPDWFTSHQSHNCLLQWYTGVSEETFHVKSYIA